MPLSKYERKEKLGYGAAKKIARQLKRSEGHVSQVISGTRRDAKVEEAVARRIGLPVEEVFEPQPSVQVAS
jgi:hypothetical protein